MFKLPEQIKEGIKDYAAAIKEFMEGRSSWSRFAGVRVPWGNYSHRGGKIFMSRVRIPAGVLTPRQLKALAHCSKVFGNGVLHLTTRQDIQIHEVRIENVIKVHEYLKGYELSSRGGGGNTVRNITACPLAGICGKEAFDVQGDAIGLTEYLLSEETSYNLPRKFKIAFSGCNTDCAACRVNDVGLAALTRDGQNGYRVYAGGGMGAKPAIAGLLEEFVPRHDMGFVIAAIKWVFYKYGDRRNKHRNRLRFLIEDIGFNEFKERYKNELGTIKGNEHISLREVNISYPEPSDDETPDVKDEGFAQFARYSCEDQKQNGCTLVKLRIPRGDLAGGKAERLAELENAFRGIEFRASRGQDLFVCNISKRRLHEFYKAVKSIFEEEDEFLYPETMLDVVACKGSVTCNLGLCNSPAMAKEIEEVIRKNFIGAVIFGKINIKLNGCPNACGQHPIGLVSLHGAARKVSGRAVPFYKLFLGGRVGVDTTKLARDTGILIPARNCPAFLKEFLSRIDSELAGGSDIYEFMDKRGEALAKEVSGKYLFVPAYPKDRTFYVDWGREEEFSLDGLGPGECGAGVLDMIEADLADARIALDAGDAKRALFFSARALLVVKGVDPRTEEEAFAGFVDKFVKTNIALGDYMNLKEIFYSGRADSAYAGNFLSHVKKLYKGMDSTFNFPVNEKKETRTATKQLKTLDLKGTPCPINYVKAKLYLENLSAGDVVEIFLDEGEPIKNVPKSLKDDGQEILNIEKQDGYYKVTVRKAK